MESYRTTKWLPRFFFFHSTEFNYCSISSSLCGSQIKPGVTISFTCRLHISSRTSGCRFPHDVFHQHVTGLGLLLGISHWPKLGIEPGTSSSTVPLWTGRPTRQSKDPIVTIKKRLIFFSSPYFSKRLNRF